MQLAPIVLFTYNRPIETSLTLESIIKNSESHLSILYVFSDAPKTEKDESSVQKVREVIKNIPTNSFKEIRVIEQKENQGLAKSIISGINKVFEDFDKIIVLEDDCEVSPYFLNFMNKSLSVYEKQSNIGSISGFSPKLKSCINNDVYAVMRSCSMSWASWKHIWKIVDFDMKNYSKLRYDKIFVQNMNRCGNDRMRRLIRQKRYDLQSWSIRFGAALVEYSLLTVYPKYSYVSNIGLESGGVHSSKKVSPCLKSSNKYGIENPILPEELEEDLLIELEFKKIYGGNWLQQLKNYINTLLNR